MASLALTQSRAGWIGFAAAVTALVLALVWLKAGARGRKTIVLGVGGALVVVFALAVVVASLQLAGMTTQLLSGMAYGYELQGWEGLVNLVNAGLYLLVAFFTARAALPAQVRGFNGGRLAAAVAFDHSSRSMRAS